MKPHTALPWEWSYEDQRLVSAAHPSRPRIIDIDVYACYEDSCPGPGATLDIRYDDREYIITAANAYPKLIELLRSTIASMRECDREQALKILEEDDA